MTRKFQVLGLPQFAKDSRNKGLLSWRRFNSFSEAHFSKGVLVGLEKQRPGPPVVSFCYTPFLSVCRKERESPN